MFYPVSNLWGIAWDSSETTHHPRHQPKRLAREQHIAAREERAARARNKDLLYLHALGSIASAQKRKARPAGWVLRSGKPRSVEDQQF